MGNGLSGPLTSRGTPRCAACRRARSLAAARAAKADKDPSARVADETVWKRRLEQNRRAFRRAEEIAAGRRPNEERT